MLFRDQTTDIAKYVAGHILDIEPVDAEGELVLDFNRATNLLCAYTVFTTCPLPPTENRLAVAIEAGERRPSSTDPEERND